MSRIRNEICFFILLLSLAALSCNRTENSSKDDLKNYISQFIGKELVLPADSSCHLFDKNYGIENLNADYAIVSYIDAEGCTPCHLKLPYWKELNNNLDTISDVYVTTLLVIKPDTLDKVTSFLEEAAYDYPVIVDTVGKWTLRNELPEINTLRTFLIDKAGKILALGNPVENEDISNIYMRIITGSKEGLSVESTLKITNNKTDLGTITPDAVRELEFLIRNNGEDSARIQSVMTPCECVSAVATDIAPKASGIVKVTFNASLTSGAFHYPIVVRYQDISSPIILHLYGMVSL